MTQKEARTLGYFENIMIKIELKKKTVNLREKSKNKLQNK